MHRARWIMVAVAMAMVGVWTYAAQGGVVSGVVVTPGGAPVADGVVTLVELRREVATDADGRFAIAGIPPGEYLVSAHSLRSGGAVRHILVVDGAHLELELELDQRVHGDAITVTATGEARGLEDEVRPVGVLAGEELAIRRDATLGDTLGQQAGVVSSTYGRGSTRPLIRGLGGDRVRILSNGLDSGDVSSVGPDHAVGIDPLAADRIEVLRGPGTLLYGANALGGVVNVLSSAIPDRRSASPLTGQVEILGGTVADEYGGAVRLDGGRGRLAWHLGLHARRADDYSSPAPHVVAGDHDDEHDGEGEEEYRSGRVGNSFTDSEGGTLGLSWVGERGFLGVAVGALDGLYGIPGHGHHHEDEAIGFLGLRSGFTRDEEEHDPDGVYTDLEQRRLDLHGRLDRPIRGLRGLSLRAGWRDYTHAEMEGGEVGTRFDNDFAEARLDALLEPVAGFSGTAGISWLDRDFAASGEEAFVLPTRTRRSAVYLYEERSADPVGAQLGVRWERQTTVSADPTLPDRDFDALSASLGASWRPAEGWIASLTWTRSERPPTAEELYSNGPHAATRAFEIGDPFLDAEVGDALDVTVRATFERFDAEISAFSTDFDDFLYLQPTGEIEDGFEVMRFTQAAARFSGFEVHSHYELMHGEPHHLYLGLTYDRVRAELVDLDEDLPRTPPQRLRVSLNYRGDRFYGEAALRWVDEQDRVGAMETTTSGHTMVDLAFGWRLFAGALMHDILLRGSNLTDEEGYDHTSFLKLEAPLAGRNVGVVYRLLF